MKDITNSDIMRIKSTGKQASRNTVHKATSNISIKAVCLFVYNYRARQQQPNL
jgi:hypothetical protein